jgi:hypothetical protein
MAHDIYIHDLAQPVLNELQRSAMKYGETLTVSFDRQQILAEARKKTGLEDFGPLDFIIRLDLLCDEWGNDLALTGIGRLGLRNKLVLFACSRLLLQREFNRHPEILNEEIVLPIIVAGLPRSGTTHLLNMLAADSRLRSLPLWEAYEPVALPGESVVRNDSSPRHERCAQNWEMMQKMTPHLAAMHPMDPDHIHEELELMGPDFASYNFEWLAVSPHWREAYYATDQTPHYRYLKKVMQYLQWQDRQTGEHKRRWVLKCPQHLEQLSVLKSVFPDATVAVTHRDPVAVIQSIVTMLAYGHRLSRHTVDTAGLLEYWSDRVEHLLRACLRDRHIFAADQSVDVLFEQFMLQDFATVQAIYTKAGLEMSATASAEINSYIQCRPRSKYGRIIYDLKSQFGVEPAELAQRFEFYYQKFAVKAASYSLPQGRKKL